MKKVFNDIKTFVLKYPTPFNLSFVWNFGIASFVFLLIQIVTGFFLSMHYIASTELAFESVENIMRNINYGYTIRYMHANGASFFFACVFGHIARTLYFRSYNGSRAAAWCVGVVILLLMIITAFTGYVLPWGQMSFWAATVITNLTSAIPLIGNKLVIWVWGGFAVGAATLSRFFAVHYILPLIIFVLTIFHIVLLHKKGSSNRLYIFYIYDKTLFHLKFTVKDMQFVSLIMIAFIIVVGFYPNALSHPDNYIPANPLVTPAHIVPEWYFLIFYAILRSIPSKLGGIVLMMLSIVALFILPFINYVQRLENAAYPYLVLEKDEKSSDWSKGLFRDVNFNFYNITFWLFISNCYVLTVIGMKSIDYPYMEIGRLATGVYFFYFFILYFKTLTTHFWKFNIDIIFACYRFLYFVKNVRRLWILDLVKYINSAQCQARAHVFNEHLFIVGLTMLLIILIKEHSYIELDGSAYIKSYFCQAFIEEIRNFVELCYRVYDSVLCDIDDKSSNLGFLFQIFYDKKVSLVEFVKEEWKELWFICYFLAILSDGIMTSSKDMSMLVSENSCLCCQLRDSFIDGLPVFTPVLNNSISVIAY